MKILHCADIHLDSRLQTNLDREGAKKRNAEILASFVRMIEYAQAEGIGAVLIAGDLFDTDKVKKSTLDTVLSCIRAHPFMEFFYVRGNHDGTKTWINPEEKPKNLNLFSDRLKTYKLRLANGRFLTISSIELNAENADEASSFLKLSPDEFNILMLHGQITASGRNSEKNIALQTLYGRNIDYLALGHVHTFQKGELEPHGVYCYAGCLEPRGFDERGEHGFVILDVDEESFSYKLRFVPFSQRRLLEVSIDPSRYGSFDALLRNTLEAVQKIDGQEKDMLILTLNGTYDDEGGRSRVSGGIAAEYLGKLLSERYYLARIRDERRLKADPSGYCSDATLKGEFIRLVSGDEKLSEERKQTILEIGLSLLRGEEL